MKVYGLCLILFISYGSFSFSQSIVEKNTPKGEIDYYCPPCGCGQDDHSFTAMGRCPSCNMALVPRIEGLTLQAQTRDMPVVGVFLFNSADIMDVTGPISVFEHAHFNVITVAQTEKPVRVGSAFEITPDFTFENLPEVDILVFPGGGMAERDPGNEAVVNFIKSHYETADVLFSVCSGAFFLGEAGLLKQQRATTFASMIPLLAASYDEAIVLNDVKYTDNGKIVTSSGLSSGIDAAFQVVSKYLGVGRTQDLANHMEYPWKRENDYARSQLADNYFYDFRNLISLFATSYFYSQGDHNQWEYRYLLTEQLEEEEILKILVRELKKYESCEVESVTSRTVDGFLENDILGKGKFELSIQDDPERGSILIVKTNRLHSFEPKTVIK